MTVYDVPNNTEVVKTETLQLIKSVEKNLSNLEVYLKSSFAVNDKSFDFIVRSTYNKVKEVDCIYDYNKAIEKIINSKYNSLFPILAVLFNCVDREPEDGNEEWKLRREKFFSDFFNNY